MKSPIPLKLKKKLAPNKEDRILIYGVHPTDLREPKKIYCFWCSLYLEKQYPCVGDIVTVLSERKRKSGEMGKFYSQLYITDIKEWEEGDFEPTGMAIALYKGKTLKDFEYEIEDM